MNATSFHIAVSRLISSASNASAEQRRLKADALIESFVLADGDLSVVASDLDRLANYVLADEISDQRKFDKETPLYTDAQLVKRDKRFGVVVSLSEVDPAGNVSDKTMDRILAEETAEKERHERRQRKVSEAAGKRRRETDEKIRQAIEANPGASKTKIARIVGVSRMTVHRYLTQKV